MYSPERVAEWNDRSSSIEYQKAYDDIVRNLPVDPKFVYVEAACGKGGILKRINHRDRYRALVGTDGSHKMLEAAQKNLKDYGFQIRDVTSLEKLSRNSQVLVLDDLLKSKMQEGLADLTIFTFPELGRDYSPSPIDKMIIGKFVSKFGGFDPSCYADLLITLRADYHLARITKDGGQIAVVEYDISRGEKSEYDQARVKTANEIWSLFGAKVEKQLFFENPEVWADTIDASEMDGKLKEAKKGYRLFLMRKNVKSR